MEVNISKVTDLAKITKVTKKLNSFGGLSQIFSLQTQHSLCRHPRTFSLIIKL